MGRTPAEVLVAYYLHPHAAQGVTLAGEAANRLLVPSVDAGEWVGQTWQQLRETATEQIVEHEGRTVYADAVGAFRHKRKWIWLLVLIPVLWPALLFVSWPKPPVRRTSKIVKIPTKSFAYTEGISAIQEGLRQLVEKGIVVLRDGVYYPTPALIKNVPHPSE